MRKSRKNTSFFKPSNHLDEDQENEIDLQNDREIERPEYKEPEQSKNGQFMSEESFLKQVQKFNDSANKEVKKLKIKTKLKTGRNGKRSDLNGNDPEEQAQGKRQKSVKKKLKLKRKTENESSKNVTEVEHIPKLKRMTTLDSGESPKKLGMSVSKGFGDLYKINGQNLTYGINLKEAQTIKGHGLNRFSSINNPFQSDLQKTKKVESLGTFKKTRGKTSDRTSKPTNLMIEQGDLFKKWEKEYGSKKVAKLIIKVDHNLDQWCIEENLPQKDNIDENKPKNVENVYQANQYQKDSNKRSQTKMEQSNGINDFDYDWDEDESMTFAKKFADKNAEERYLKHLSKEQSNKKYVAKVAEYQQKRKTKEKDDNYFNEGKDELKKSEPNKVSNDCSIDDWDEE